jgi:hypothetical protein
MSRPVNNRILSTVLFLFAAIATASAQDNKELGQYTWQVDAAWWFSNPTGSIHGTNNSGSFDLSRDLGFGSYSTFSGTADWHFKRRHHLLLRVAPVKSERSVTLANQIEFQGVTYNVGAQVNAEIRTLSFAPGYEYDFIRRDHGYLGGAVQFALIDTKASLSGIGTVNGVSATRTASGSVFAPLPTIGLVGRWYPMHDSDRFSLGGYVHGMYFFGYGDFISARALASVKLHSHWNFIAGYEMGTDLSIHGNVNRIGVRLTQKGPIAGLEASW